MDACTVSGLCHGHACALSCKLHTCLRRNNNTGSFTETELGEVKFPEIPTPILEKVCQYFYYKLRYQNS